MDRQFNDVLSAIDFIENQRANSTDLSIFKQVLAKYDNFQDQLEYVHITGTNGKGSTSKLVNDMLINSNYKVGLFTSPHLIVSNDRIRINNEYISDEDLLIYVNKFYADIIYFQLNFFQIYTLIALAYFYDQKCDIAVIEVGIGGLLDSTNVIDGIVSVITNINFDHTDRLGDSFEAIAYQKSGIIKANKHTVTMVTDQSALALIKDVAVANNNTLVALTPIQSEIINHHQVFTIDNVQYSLNSLAKYQVLNSQIAIEVMKILNDNYGYNVTVESIRQALNEFVWFGRYEKVSEEPLIILDGAHNIAGIKSLIKSTSSDYVVIFSALKDKDYLEMLNLLNGHFKEVVFNQFDFYRALKLEDVSDKFEKYADFEQALDYVKQKYPNNAILICGSLYFISEVRKQFKEE